MPHEVIMPALGMAQDSGVLVAWLKEPGSPVKAGDALMEVETDKATMEVEAQHDGYLIDLRAKAGQDVPVGEVVAVIAESPDADPPAAQSDTRGQEDGGKPESAPAEASPTAPEAAAEPDMPDGKSVIMPALGMAQDAGLIVGWSVKPGDKVGADDTLMEVETDKSTMEVPAGHDGFVAAILAAEGEEVPIGEVIAIISAEAPANPIVRSRAEGTPAPAPEPAAAPSSAPPAAAEPKAPTATSSITAAPRHQGPVLASPKLKRLAAEEGLDLNRLLDAGYAGPFHVKDLDILRSLPGTEPQAAPPGADLLPQGRVAAAGQRLTADLPETPLVQFLDWLAAESGGSVGRAPTLAAFAAASLREATGTDAGAVATEGSLPGARRVWTGADRTPIAGLAPAGDDATPVLVVRDLTGTAITGVAFGDAGVPVLTLARGRDGLSLTYEGALPPEAAIALTHGFAARLAEPLRHLL